MHIRRTNKLWNMYDKEPTYTEQILTTAITMLARVFVLNIKFTRL